MKVKHFSILLLFGLSLNLFIGSFIETDLLNQEFKPNLSVQDSLVAVLIESNDDFFDKYGFSGSGTKGSPYIINNHYIQAISTTPCLWIKNTDAYFTIYNCDFLNGKYGIRLDNVENGLIDFNDFFDTVTSGITLVGDCLNINITRNTIQHTYQGIAAGTNPENLLITDNTIYNTSYGVWFSGGGFSNISNNEIHHIDRKGINLQSTDNNSVLGNTIYDVYNTSWNADYRGTGIRVSASENNTIAYNSIDDIGYYGIELFQSVQYNVFDHNNISNTIEDGIYFVYSSCKYNTFSYNIIKDIDNYAVWGAYSNYFYYNTIRNISLNALSLHYESKAVGNTIEDCASVGISVLGPNVTVEGNIINNCGSSGISMGGGYYNIAVIGNTITNNVGHGVVFSYVGNITFEDNVLSNNSGNNIYHVGSSIDHYTYHMSNNTIDGENLVFLRDQQQPVVPEDFGYLWIVNCTNFAITDKIFESGISGLIIANSSDFFVKNNVFRSVYYGLDLFEVNNGIITGNEVYNCLYGGFQTRYSTDMVFSYNQIYSNTFFAGTTTSIYLDYCNDSKIIFNELYDNFGNGIYTIHGFDNEIAYNVLTNNSHRGIFSVLDNRTIISHNYISESNTNGIYLSSADNTLVFANNVSNCLEEGIELQSVDNSIVFLNSFYNNTVQAYDNNGENVTFEMNYWDGFSGSDGNSDGFLDDPYVFTSNTDLKPLTSPYTMSNPTIISPNGGESLNDSITIDWSAVTDSLGFSITYSVLYSTDLGLNWFEAITDLGGDMYSWDSKGYSNSTDYMFMVLAINSYGVTTFDVTDGMLSINNVAHRLTKPGITHPTADLGLVSVVGLTWMASVDTWDDAIVVTYNVQYSPDGGTTWFELVGGTSQTSFYWDTTAVSDGTNYLIKVVATSNNGLVSEATSDLFSVLNHPATTTTDPGTSESTETSTSSFPSSTSEPTSPTPTPAWTLLIGFLSLLVVMIRKRRKKQ